MNRRRVVVTGLGIVCPLGNTVQEAWDKALAGTSGIARITRFDPSRLASQIAGEVKNLDATMPVYEMKTLESQLDETLLTDRLIALLSAGFGLLATVLASIGLYGVMAFVVARRRKELGIGLALGAQPSGVVWLVMREVLVLLAIGLAIGVPTALALGRFVGGQLYGIQPNDPWMATATLAHRASRIDPILALRYE